MRQAQTAQQAQHEIEDLKMRLALLAEAFEAKGKQLCEANRQLSQIYLLSASAPPPPLTALQTLIKQVSETCKDPSGYGAKLKMFHVSLQLTLLQQFALICWCEVLLL